MVEKYSDETIQKFLIHQVARNNHMDVHFLQSLGESAICLSSANVKVKNAKKICFGAIRQSWRDNTFVTEAN